MTFDLADPDRPVILTQVFNQHALPPAFSGAGSLPGNRYLSGTRPREIQGQRGSQLHFDDTHGIRLEPGGGVLAALNLPKSKIRTNERAVLRHRQTGEPIAGQRYSVQLDDGSTVDGTTDEQGRSALFVDDLIRVAKVTFFRDESGAS